MKYKPRPGIVSVSICGAFLLIPTREVYNVCNSALRLPIIWGVVYEMMREPIEEQKIRALICGLKRRPESEIRERFDRFCEELWEKGFLIRVSEEALQTEDDIQARDDR